MQAYLDHADQRAQDFIVRVGWKALALCDADGAPFRLISRLETFAPGTSVQESAVQVETGTAQQPRPLALRLIAVPLPPEKAADARLRLKRTANKHQDRFDPRSLTAAGFMVLATTLPQAVPAAEIVAVYRLRWQIELAFKRLKSLLHIDRLPTRTKGGSLSWLYAHLIVLLVSEDICRDVLDSSP